MRLAAWITLGCLDGVVGATFDDVAGGDAG